MNNEVIESVIIYDFMASTAFLTDSLPGLCLHQA